MFYFFLIWVNRTSNIKVRNHSCAFKCCRWISGGNSRFLQNSYTTFWNETFQLLQLSATPILPLTAIKATNLSEAPVQYRLFHKALLWKCHYSERVCLSVCNWQRRRQTKKSLKDIKRRWRRDRESSQRNSSFGFTTQHGNGVCALPKVNPYLWAAIIIT